MSNLKDAIRYMRESINATSEEHLDWTILPGNPKFKSSKRPSKLKVIADLEDTIRIAQEAINATPDDHSDQAKWLNNLGTALGKRYSWMKKTADLEEAIQVIRKAIDITPEDRLDRAKILNNLGIQLGKRYSRNGMMADLDESIRVTWEAVNMTSEHHADRVLWLFSLGDSLCTRYKITTGLSDLEDAIRVAQEGLNITSENYSGRTRFFDALADRLTLKFSRTGAIADLDQAIQATRKAVDTDSAYHEGQNVRLGSLAGLLGRRYSRTGAIDDLNEAVQIVQDAVNSDEIDFPLGIERLRTLGALLGKRYTRVGAVSDLEDAIRFTREAVNMAREDEPERILFLNDLGVALGHKYLRLGVIADLEEAIQVTREAIQAIQKAVPATIEVHLSRTLLLDNLGSLLGDRYSRTEAIDDLEEAILVAREAVDTIPEGVDGLEHAGRLNNVGTTLSSRFWRFGEIADLEEAIQFIREAVSKIPDDHPDRATIEHNLGNQLRDRYLTTGEIADLEEAVLHYQSALRHSNTSISTRIFAGIEVLRCCAIISDWQQACEGSAIAVHLIPQLTARSLENTDKQHILSEVVGLACDATAAALHVEKAPIVALNLLEQGRGILAASLEEMRADMLDLQRRYPKLAAQFVRLRNELEPSFKRNLSFSEENRQPSFQARASQLYVAGQELDELIIKIRKQPGFEDFLLPPTKEEIQAAARSGPIIVINVSEYRCDALLVEQHQIRSLALPNLNSKEIKEKGRREGLKSLKVLAWLWDTVANPILDALEFTQPPSDDNWPHVWWIPTGALSKFPLHAAGRHREGSTETVLDRVMSSYSSSIKAIIHGRRRQRGVQEGTPPALNHALLVAMQDTPQHSRLLSATKEVEALQGLCKSMAFNPIEPGRRKQDIISHLPNCKIFHFAGHGHTDDIDPLQSYLLLEDWGSNRLTVATLLEINLRERSPFLAYLSACGTGEVKEERFFDESVHLISACQLAGFRHVIGTLWEVNDKSCVDMAKITYEGIRDGAMTDESVCRGLHKATRELRDRWLSVPTKARRGSRSVKKVYTPLAEDEIGAITISDGDQCDSRLPRKVILCDSDEEDDRLLHWVPYVHFGV